MKIRLCLPLFLVFLLAACQPAPANTDALATQIVATAAVSIQQTVLASMPTPAPERTAAPTPQPAAAAPFTGIWIAENGDVLVLTDALLYYRFTKGDAVYEHLGEVQGYDLDTGEIDFFLQGIRLNGKGVGYDSPQNKARYTLDGDTLAFEVLVDPENPAAGVRLSGAFRRGFTDRFPPQ